MFQSVRKMTIAAAFAASLLAIFAGSAAAAPLEAKTENPTEITQVSARLHGTVAGHSGDKVAYAFQYGTAAEPNFEGEHITEVTVIEALGTSHLSAKLTGLANNMPHHVRLIAVDLTNGEEAAGSDVKFTTLKYGAGNTRNGVFLTGNPAHFEAEKLGTAIEVEPESGFLILRAGVDVTCGKTYLNARTASTASLKLNAYFEECTWDSAAATVKMNSCYYVLNVTTPGPSFGGSFGLGCEKAGDAMEVSISGCTVKVEAQTPGGSLSYANFGSGSSRYVVSVGSASEVHYTKIGGIGCLFAGNGKNGSFGGGVSLVGYQ